MKHFLDISEILHELIRRLPPDIKRGIRETLTEIQRNPGAGKPLIEELEGLRSYKMGRYRIIYRTKTDAIEIIGIGPRKTIYQKIALEMKRLREKEKA